MCALETRTVKWFVVAGLWGRRCEWSDGFIFVSGGMRIPGGCTSSERIRSAGDWTGELN